MAVNLTTVHFLAFVLAGAVCCMLIQSTAAQESSSSASDAGGTGSTLNGPATPPTTTTTPATTPTTPTTTTTPTPLNGFCTPGITTCISNLTCINNRCGCNETTDYYQFSTVSCVPKKSYGALCNASDSSSNVCLDPNTECKKPRTDSSPNLCLCADTFYRSDQNDCISVNNLVTSIYSFSTTIYTAHLTWTDKTSRNNVTFIIASSSNPINTSVTKVNETVVSGLTPGTRYTFFLTSVLAADDYYDTIRRSSDNFTIFTKPSAPVNVTWDLETNRSSESQFVYAATITKGGGNAASFLFTLVGPNYSTSLNVSALNMSEQTVITNFTLKLDETYNYTVKAQNDNGDQSQPLYGNFTPVNKAANNVRWVQLNSFLDKNLNQVNLNITWQPGDITGKTFYYIQLTEASTMDDSGLKDTVLGYNNTSYTVQNVRAYWYYNVSVMAGTRGGNSSWVSVKNRTVESAANVITDLNLTSNRNASTNKVNLVITWMHGGFTGLTTYYIWVKEVTGTGLKDVQNDSVEGYDNLSYTLNDVKPSTTYNVSVRAGTSAGNSSWVSNETKTTESSANSISDLMLNSSRDPSTDQINLFISWTPGNYTGDTTYYIFVEKAADSSGAHFANSMSYAVYGYNTTRYNVTQGLLPYWFYNVSVVAGTSKGNSSEVYSTIRTAESVGRDVKDIHLNSSRDASTNQVNLLVNWQPGALTGNTTYYILVELLVNGVAAQIKEIAVPGYDIKSSTLSDVLAFSNYNVSIKAGTSVGNSSLLSKSITTAESCPGKVENFSVIQHPEKAKYVIVSFSCPSVHNGTLLNFTIKYMILDSNSSIMVTPGGDCGVPLNNVTINKVVVEQNYTFAMNAETKACPGPLQTDSVYTFPKAPILKDVFNAFGPFVKPHPNSDFTEKIKTTVCPKCLLDDSQGNVTNVGLIICVKESATSCSNTGRRRRAAPGFKDYITWAKAKEYNFNQSYRTTPDDWIQTLDKDEMSQEYDIGDDTSCRTSDKKHCNGPLPSGREFLVQVIVCTNGGCSLFDEVEVFSTQSAPEEANVGAIVGGVLGGLALLAVIGVIIFLVWHFRRRNHYKDSSRPSQRLPQIIERRPVKMRDFNDHVLRFHKDSNLLFQDEYDNIQTLSKSFTYSANDAQNEANKIKNRYNDSSKLTHFEAQKEANRVKNRYVDILPFDQTRVKLSTLPEDDDTNDFINANYIPGYSSPREYIASQGPMHCTFPDFWKMIWEQNSRIIVMLSDLVEAGKRKVDMYWPENLNEPINYGSVVVEMTNFSQLNKEIIRNFTMTKGEETRKVMHFFMPEWPDFGAKIGKDRLIDFIKLVRQEVKPSTSQGPIIVHCSAGVGRTGTYIAIDYFMQFVEKHSLDEELDVFDFVLKMRRHRPRMVQVENQYIFIHDVINKLIQKKIQDEKMKEERIYENTNGNVYANYNQEENIYANGQVKGSRYEYSNDAFEPDLASDTNLLSEKPLTEL